MAGIELPKYLGEMAPVAETEASRPAASTEK
jgi:hypothetical protein